MLFSVMFRIASHPARGAWIEIRTKRLEVQAARRSHPARGAWIEILPVIEAPWDGASHPARGAWIEMEAGGRKNAQTLGRTPQGVRGLKWIPPNE